MTGVRSEGQFLYVVIEFVVRTLYSGKNGATGLGYAKHVKYTLRMRMMRSPHSISHSSAVGTK